VSLLKKIKLCDDWRPMDFEPLLAGTVFREPQAATSAADLDVITLCSRSRPWFQPELSPHSCALY
jgi:hypothetical protein